MQTGDLHPNSPRDRFQGTCFQQTALRVSPVLDSSDTRSNFDERAHIPIILSSVFNGIQAARRFEGKRSCGSSPKAL